MSYSALFLHPDLQARTQFKKTAQELNLFSNLSLETRLGEGLERLRGSQTYHVVYISSRYDRHLSSKWIEGARISPQGKTSAYIAVLKPEETPNAAKLVIEGSDAELGEGFLPADLEASAIIGASVYHERKRMLEIEAIKTMAKKLPGLVDLRYEAELGGRQTPTALQLLLDTKRKIHLLEPELQDIFMDAVVDNFSMVHAPSIAERSLPQLGRQGLRVQRVVMRTR